MRRRDLNPGDVFVYVDTSFRHPGAVRYVDGQPGWFEGALKSPEFGGPLSAEVLDRTVVKLTRPAGRLERRAEIKAMLHKLAVQAEEMAQELDDSSAKL